MSTLRDELRGPKIGNGWMGILQGATVRGIDVDPHVRGGLRTCRLSVWATCCLKPAASVEDTHI